MMARNAPPPGKCIHCFEFRSDLTWDHILPRSYYSKTGPQDFEKWCAPACPGCNGRLGKIEEDFLTRVALSLNPRPDVSSPTAEISQRMLRSMNPMAGKNESDQEFRRRKAIKYFRQISRAESDQQGIFPNFGFHVGWKPEEQYAIIIPSELPETFAHKVLRGLEYCNANRYLDDAWQVTISFTEEEKVLDVVQLIRTAERVAVAPDFVFYRFPAPDETAVLYEVRIWDKFIFYACALSKAVFPEAGE